MNTNKSNGIVTDEVLDNALKMFRGLSRRSIKYLHKAEPSFVEMGEFYANFDLLVPLGTAIEEYCAEKSDRKKAKIRTCIVKYLHRFVIDTLFYGLIVGLESVRNAQASTNNTESTNKESR